MSRTRRRTPLRSLLPIALALGLLLLTGGPTPVDAQSTPSETTPTQKTKGGKTGTEPDPRPTIVLVHGAFADASGWNRVSMNLQQRGYPVIAPANPLRGLASDAAYLRSVLDTIDGPIVLVGHSYGGMVMTQAAPGHPGVEALVYIAAFAPDTGESVGSLSAQNPGSAVTPENLMIRDFPGGQDGYIKDSVFQEVFAGDLPDTRAAIMAASQRPSSLSTLGEAMTGAPAWKAVPSWYLIAEQDKVIPPATQEEMAERAGASVVSIDSSHVAMMSHHGKTTSLILQAARQVG